MPLSASKFSLFDRHKCLWILFQICFILFIFFYRTAYRYISCTHREIFCSHFIKIGKKFESCLFFNIRCFLHNCRCNGVYIRFRRVVVKSGLHMCRNNVKIKVSLVSAGTYISSGPSLHYIINGLIPIFPAVSAKVDSHDFLFIDPFAGRFHCFHKCVTVKGNGFLVFTYNGSCITACNVNQTVRSGHWLKSEEIGFLCFIMFLQRTCCISNILPGSKYFIRIQAHFFKHIFSIVNYLCSSPYRKAVHITFTVPAIIHEGFYNVIFVKFRICSNIIIHIFQYPFFRKRSGVYVAAQITGRNFSGCNRRLQHLTGLLIA